MVEVSTVDSWGHLLAGLNFAAYRFWCHLSWPLSCRLRWTSPFSWHLTVARSTKQSCSCCFPDMMKTVMAKWRWTRDEGDGTCFTNYLQQSMYSKPVVFICVNALAGNIHVWTLPTTVKRRVSGTEMPNHRQIDRSGSFAAWFLLWMKRSRRFRPWRCSKLPRLILHWNGTHKAGLDIVDEANKQKSVYANS